MLMDDTQSAPAGPVGSNPGPSLERLCILLVEDEPIVALLIEDMLTELGCRQVLHAASVPEALAILRTRRPDAAVLDINLRNVLVYPVAECLAAAHIPFTFATGYGRGGVAGRWKDTPMIQKPIERSALAAALGSMLER
jgi:CheY-like chemotaxis protein